MSDFRFGFAVGADKMELIKSLGADYIELNFRDLYSSDDAEIERIGEASERLGLPVEAANCMMPGDIKVVGGEVDYGRIEEYLETASRKAHSLGVDTVVFGSSASRMIPEGFDRSNAMEQLLVFLRDYTAPVFEKYDLRCAIENLSFDETNTFNMTAEAYDMVRAVGSDRIGILVDFYHFGKNNDSFDSVRQAGDKLFHIHSASVLNARCYPAPNDGENADYAAQTALLRETGYDRREGRISFEARQQDGKSFEECARASLEAFGNI